MTCCFRCVELEEQSALETDPEQKKKYEVEISALKIDLETMKQQRQKRKIEKYDFQFVNRFEDALPPQQEPAEGKEQLTAEDTNGL